MSAGRRRVSSLLGKGAPSAGYEVPDKNCAPAIDYADLIPRDDFYGVGTLYNSRKSLYSKHCQTNYCTVHVQIFSFTDDEHSTDVQYHVVMIFP